VTTILPGRTSPHSHLSFNKEAIQIIRDTLGGHNSVTK